MNSKTQWTLGATLIVVGAIAFGLSAQPFRGGDRRGDGPPRLDIAAAAQSLGVTEDALIEALGLPERGPQDGPRQGPRREDAERQPPDLAAAAEILGVSEQALRDALGDPSQGPPDLAAAAGALGITEEALREALGLPDGVPGDGHDPGDRGERRLAQRPPRLDFAAAAETLGVSVEALMDALGVSSQTGP